jgi:hypothetical protein
MAIGKLEKINGACQLMNDVDNPIPFWATSHRDLGCPWATLPILDFRIPDKALGACSLLLNNTCMGCQTILFYFLNLIKFWPL